MYANGLQTYSGSINNAKRGTLNAVRCWAVGIHPNTLIPVPILRYWLVRCACFFHLEDTGQTVLEKEKITPVSVSLLGCIKRFSIHASNARVSSNHPILQHKSRVIEISWTSQTDTLSQNLSSIQVHSPPVAPCAPSRSESQHLISSWSVSAAEHLVFPA